MDDLRYTIDFLRGIDFAKLVWGSQSSERETEDSLYDSFDILVFRQPKRDSILRVPILGKNVHQWLTFLKTLSSSKNGVAGMGEITKHHLNKHNLALKAPIFQEGHVTDPIEYEFVIQTIMNYLRFRIPNFTFGFALFRCKALIAPKKGKPDKSELMDFCQTKTRSIKRKTQVEIPTEEGEERKYEVVEATFKTQLYSFILMEKVEPGIPFYEVPWKYWNKWSRDPHAPGVWLSHICQILMALQIAQDYVQFVHYDLHYENVLVQELQNCCDTRLPTKRVWFHYYHNGRVIKLPTDYLMMIIDFGRSHVSRRLRKNVANLYGFPRSSYEPKGLYKQWDGSKSAFGISPKKFHPTFDVLRFFTSTFDMSPDFIKDNVMCSSLRQLFDLAFPDYKELEFGTTHTEEATNPRARKRKSAPQSNCGIPWIWWTSSWTARNSKVSRFRKTHLSFIGITKRSEVGKHPKKSQLGNGIR